MPEALTALPSPGAGAMLLVEAVDDRQLLAQLLPAMYPQLTKHKKGSKHLKKRKEYREKAVDKRQKCDKIFEQMC